jgi:hypothetical protein
MKKIILSIACSVATALTFAQIPNFSFENWTSMGSYEVPNGWGTLNNTTTGTGVYTATKATPGNPGSYYMKLTSLAVGSVVVNGIAVSGELDSITTQPKSGFAFNLRPANFTGKWQHMIYGSSQGSIRVTLTRWDANLNQRVTVGTASVTLSGMAMSWANFTLPFNYADGGYPDTCIIVMKASGSNPTNNDYLWVDNLAFSGSVTSIENQSSFLNSINVYPNPASENIVLDLNFNTLQKVVFEIKDISGKTILTKSAGILTGETRQSLSVKGISKGTYFIYINGEQGSEARKIVIE